MTSKPPADLVIGCAEAITEGLRLLDPVLANSIAGSVAVSLAVAWKRYALSNGDAEGCSRSVRRLGDMLVAVAAAETDDAVVAVSRLHADAEQGEDGVVRVATEQ